MIFIFSSDICNEFLFIMDNYRGGYNVNGINENEMITMLSFNKYFIFNSKQLVFGSFLTNVCS